MKKDHTAIMKVLASKLGDPNERRNVVVLVRITPTMAKLVDLLGKLKDHEPSRAQTVRIALTRYFRDLASGRIKI